MWLVVLVAGCQDQVLEQVTAITHISTEVTHRPGAASEPIASEPPAPGAEPASSRDYNPISVPQGARDTPGFSMPGVGRKSSPTGERIPD